MHCQDPVGARTGIWRIHHCTWLSIRWQHKNQIHGDAWDALFIFSRLICRLQASIASANLSEIKASEKVRSHRPSEFGELRSRCHAGGDLQGQSSWRLKAERWLSPVVPWFFTFLLLVLGLQARIIMYQPRDISAFQTLVIAPCCSLTRLILLLFAFCSTNIALNSNSCVQKSEKPCLVAWVAQSKHLTWVYNKASCHVMNHEPRPGR